jgi:cellobiose phosphorylase
MESLRKRLVRSDAGLILLFDPPLDHSNLNPGYVKGYIPGVRENGGQYTHGAIWATMASALEGNAELAWEWFRLLNPVHHGSTAEKIAVYKVEPYVVAADVYGVAPHVGRGGWTWYTGSAGWMYQLLVESLLGIHLEGDQLRFTPLLPREWDHYRIRYRFRQTVYRLVFRRMTGGVANLDSIRLDGVWMSGRILPLRDDQVEHLVEIEVA